MPNEKAIQAGCMVPCFITIFLLALSSCAAAPIVHGEDLMSDIKADVTYTNVEISGEDAVAIADFAVACFNIVPKKEITP